MSVNGVWDAHCDECAYWDPNNTADSRPEAIRHARAAGWLVTRAMTLCPECRAKVTPSTTPPTE